MNFIKLNLFIFVLSPRSNNYLSRCQADSYGRIKRYFRVECYMRLLFTRFPQVSSNLGKRSFLLAQDHEAVENKCFGMFPHFSGFALKNPKGRLDLGYMFCWWYGTVENGLISAEYVDPLAEGHAFFSGDEVWVVRVIH